MTASPRSPPAPTVFPQLAFVELRSPPPSAINEARMPLCEEFSFNPQALFLQEGAVLVLRILELRVTVTVFRSNQLRLL
jgi:hypothetical protein